MGYESMNVSKDMAYKYRARYYYTNRSNNQTYYGRWSNYRYFAMPSISGKTTNKKKGIKVVLKKGTGIKQYTVSVSKNSKSGFKKVKTVKVSKKKSYSFQITKNGKKKLKKGTYYVQVAPKVKFGNKTYSSDVSTVASCICIQIRRCNMVKNFLKRTLCIVLSFAMMTGTVMVGAKTKTESIHSKLPAITASQRVRAKQAKASAEAVQLNATNVYTLSDFDTLSNKWQANQEMMLYQGYSDANEYVKVGTVRVGIDGTVVIPYATKVAGVDGGRLKLCYNGNPAMTLSQTNNGKMIWAGAVKAGTYALYLETACENANTPVVAAFGAAVISSQNNRTFGGNNVIASASTGAATYQQFKVSKRGVAAIAVYKENAAGNVSSVIYSVQKLSGKTWKTVATGLAGVAKNNYVVTTGLAAGTYRVVANAASGEILYFINANQKASDSYGTSKKKAKEIKRKKSKKQVFLSNESTSKTHWYKIKVKKTGMTYIDITGLGNKSKISVTVTGAARLKNKTISKGFRIYGKAKKGTYYIKIKKGSKGTSGYQVKYTK